jgi:cardiolipin synthase
VRIGNTIGAAILDRRVLGPVEARLTSLAGLALCSLAVVVALFPRVLAYPVAALGLWGGVALLWRGLQLRRSRKPPREASIGDAAATE